MKKLGVILIGIISIAVGIFIFLSGQGKVKRCTIETVGTVVGINQESSIDEDGITTYTYYPIIEYNVGDRKITKQSENGSGASEYMLNDKVDILYNPENIEEFIIKGDKSNIIGIVFVVVGIIVVGTGIIKRF